MRKCNWICLLGIVAVGLTLSGCTVHPPGEREERQNALAAGKPYEKRPEDRRPAPLADHPSPDDLVRYALLTNADVEQKYWQWRSALEQVVIDGTQSTSLAISLGTTLNNGAAALDRTNLTAENDPMTDISFPDKLSVAAKRSLENAGAAGRRFRQAQFELRKKVLYAYDDYALNGVLIELGQQNIQLLQTVATLTEARAQTAAVGQPDVLKARNEIDLARNDLANMQARLPIERAVINALLDRSPAAAIAVPTSLGKSGEVSYSDEQLLDLAAKENPELTALAAEIRGKKQDIHLARLQYYPDFDVAAGTDLKGVTQSVMGVFTVPILRYEALDAAVAQAQVNLRAAEAMRRQTANDLSTRIVDDISTLHDADRQLDLFEKIILPRARQVVTIDRSTYESGNASLLDVLDNERALIDIERLVATLRDNRDKRLVDIESIDASRLYQEVPSTQCADNMARR